MATYTFQNAENTSARRDNDDGSFSAIPWATDPVEPLYLDSVSGRQWVEDGSPVPAPYVEPAQLPPVPPPETTVLYDHENRLLVLEGQPPMSLDEFIAKMRGV